MHVSAEVVDVNLLDRIDQRLSDTRARINPHDFEDCATSLLSPSTPHSYPSSEAPTSALTLKSLRIRGSPV